MGKIYKRTCDRCGRSYEGYGKKFCSPKCAIRPLVERFWEKVNKTESDEDCWDWIANSDDSGYGALKVDGIMQKAHRVAWELVHGKMPEGLCILHNCDRPSCVNIKHLRIGTQKENIGDMLKRGRGNHAKGERVNTAKLTEKQIPEIRLRLQQGEQQSLIAKSLGLCRGTINHIASNRTWTHVK
jgi:hypothetical protein